jgi:hypothetical protein
MNRTVDAAASEQARVGSVDDRIHGLDGNVAFDREDPLHGSLLLLRRS